MKNKPTAPPSYPPMEKQQYIYRWSDSSMIPPPELTTSPAPPKTSNTSSTPPKQTPNSGTISCGSQAVSLRSPSALTTFLPSCFTATASRSHKPAPMALPYKSAMPRTDPPSPSPTDHPSTHTKLWDTTSPQLDLTRPNTISSWRKQLRYLTTAPADRCISFLFYFSLYLPSIGWVLPQCFYTPAELKQIESKSMPLIFAKCRHNHNSPKILMYGHPSLSGGGFIRLYMIQGKGQIQLFLKFWRTQSEISQVLLITLAWCQYQAGTSKPVLEHPKDHIPYLEARWLPSLRTFLASIDASIELDKTYCIPHQRQGDYHLMDKANYNTAFTDRELHELNCCRLYLGVTLLSDICNTQGTQSKDSKPDKHDLPPSHGYYGDNFSDPSPPPQALYTDL
jgi:hypothetical protein